MKVQKNFIFFPLLMTLIGCVAQPRYTSEPIETRRYQPLEEKSREKIDPIRMSQIIESFLGTPYKEGGSDKSGTDCSGFVMRIYKEYAGFDLPHNSKKLFKQVRKIDKEELAYGDLVFFSDFGFSPSHVGIYIGERRFVHSTKEYGVIVSSLDEERYRKSYIGARRVIP